MTQVTRTFLCVHPERLLRSLIPQLDDSWLRTPDERSPAFFPVFARVSVAVQKTLREQVPSAYFANMENFLNTKTAYPMLVYQASQPFHGKLRTELTYDVLNPKTLAALFRTVKVGLPELLVNVEERLRAANLDVLSSRYAPKRAPEIVQSVQRLSKSRKCLYILIRAEALLVNALLELGGLGDSNAKGQARRAASFEKKWNFQLRRLYPATDFAWLAPELLHRATQALLSSLDPEAPMPSDAGPAATG